MRAEHRTSSSLEILHANDKARVAKNFCCMSLPCADWLSVIKCHSSSLIGHQNALSELIWISVALQGKKSKSIYIADDSS